jgi:hypothetical protein
MDSAETGRGCSLQGVQAFGCRATRGELTSSARSTGDATYEHMETRRCVSRICASDGAGVLSRSKIKNVSRCARRKSSVWGPHIRSSLSEEAARMAHVPALTPEWKLPTSRRHCWQVPRQVTPIDDNDVQLTGGNCRGLETSVKTQRATYIQEKLTKERLVSFRPSTDKVALCQNVEQPTLQELLGTQLCLRDANQKCYLGLINVQRIQIL